MHGEKFYVPFSMKATTLVLALVCAVGFSSCCCQSQPMPPLRPLPRDCGDTQDALPQQVVEPIKVLPQKGK